MKTTVDVTRVAIRPGGRLEAWLSLSFCTTLSHGMAAFFSVTKKLQTLQSRSTTHHYTPVQC